MNKKDFINYIAFKYFDGDLNISDKKKSFYLQEEDYFDLENILDNIPSEGECKDDKRYSRI